MPSLIRAPLTGNLVLSLDARPYASPANSLSPRAFRAQVRTLAPKQLLELIEHTNLPRHITIRLLLEAL